MSDRDYLVLDANGRLPEDDDYEPPCDVWGDCAPFPEEDHHAEAMCRFCGGWRYKDHPDLGNWGVK